MRRAILLLPFLFSCASAVKEVEQVQVIQPVSHEKEERKEESLYDRELQRKMTELLRTEPTPLRVPDTVVRVLILPYVDEKGNLISQKYVFFRAEEGRWILGEYLLQRGKPLKELKPLEEDVK